MCYDEARGVFGLAADPRLDPQVIEALARQPVRLGEDAAGLAGLRRGRGADRGHRSGGLTTRSTRSRASRAIRALLAVPLLREDELIGALVLCRESTPGAFTAETIDLVQTLADQSALAIQNARCSTSSSRRAGSSRRRAGTSRSSSPT